METLLSFLMSASKVAQVQHWATHSFAQHIALGELYEILSKFSDELAEIYAGNHELGQLETNGNFGLDHNDAKEFIKQLYAQLESFKGTIPQDAYLVNKYEELQGEVTRIKYKIERLA